MRAFIFDLGGTLVDYVGFSLNWASYYTAAFERVKTQLELELDGAAITNAIAGLTKYNARIYPREIEYSSEHIFAEATSNWNLGRHTHTDVAMAFYGFFQEKMEVFPDAVRLLRKLEPTRLKIGVLTDLATGMPDEMAIRCVSALNSRIDSLLTSYGVGYRKPNPLGYRSLAAKLGVDAEDCVYIGDEDKDIAGANSAGMVSVLIDRKKSQSNYGQRYRVESLDEIVVLFADELLNLR